MDTKHIHCMLEKISEYGKCMMEEAVGAGNVNLDDAGKIVDMVKDLACAEKDALIAKEMRKAHEEDESEEKYFLKMLKEEKQDEYKRMKEEYGEDEGERRFYDRYRYKNGRFAPKGRGTRRTYVEPPYYHVMPDMYEDYSAEEMRDLDRHKGRLYFTPMNMDGKKGTDSGNYADGYSDGQKRGYSDGYEKGMTNGRKSGGLQSRYDRARRGYTETKMSDDGTPEHKKKSMESLDKYMKELADDMSELVGDMDSSEKAMLKSKLSTLAQKIQ